MIQVFNVLAAQLLFTFLCTSGTPLEDYVMESDTASEYSWHLSCSANVEFQSLDIPS